MKHTEGTTFNFLRGYEDATGFMHTDFEIRPMDGSDEEAIANPMTRKNGAKVIRVLLERCCIRIGTIYQSDLKEKEWTEIIQSLNTGDQDVMLLHLRAISVGEDLETHYKCPDPECKTDIKVLVNVDEIEMKPWNGNKFIEFELPNGGYLKDSLLKTGKLRHPNGLDREILDGVIRKNVGKANTSLLTRLIVDMEGKKVDDSFVRNLSYKDRQYLLDLLKDEGFGVDLNVEVTCPNCSETFEASLNVVNFI